MYKYASPKNFYTQQDKLSWNLSGTISPSTAPPDKGAAEIMTNGVVTTAGKTGQSGNGYMAATIASTLSIPIGAADIFLSGQFDKYGSVTTGSVTYQKGSSTSLSAGAESLLSEKITLTPYARLRINAASSYSIGTNIAANNDFDLGMSITNDISNSTSVRIGAEYNVVNDYAVTYANGNKLSFSGKGYTFTLSSMFFF